jgi:hypothetical protein
MHRSPSAPPEANRLGLQAGRKAGRTGRRVLGQGAWPGATPTRVHARQLPHIRGLGRPQRHALSALSALRQLRFRRCRQGGTERAAAGAAAQRPARLPAHLKPLNSSPFTAPECFCRRASSWPRPAAGDAGAASALWPMMRAGFHTHTEPSARPPASRPYCVAGGQGHGKRANEVGAGRSGGTQN